MNGSASPGRVAVALHEPEFGGATQALLQALPLLEARGWSFTFWVPGQGAAEDELRRRGYEVSTAERPLRFSLASLREFPGPLRRLAGMPAYARRWRAWLRAQEAALVHGNSILALPEVVSRPRPGPPVVLHTHEILPNGPKGALAGLLARQADAVVAVSEAAARPLRRWGIAATIVRPGAPAVVCPRPVKPDGPLVVGTMGTVARRKGSELFVSAAECVRRKGESVEFRMAGSLVVGSERSWAQDVVEMARRANIDYRSWVDPMVELAEWDILLLPAREDPFPLVVLEAMAMGLPIVAARVGGIPEQLGDGAGLLTAAEDVEEMAAAVVRLARSPELRASLGAAARRRVQTLFTLERQAEGLDRVYRAALKTDLATAP